VLGDWVVGQVFPPEERALLGTISLMSKSILIIGGGVIGLCAAYYAQRAGHEVTVLEREPLSHDDGCSTGNAGMVVPSHFVPLAAPGMPALGLKMMLRRDSPFAIRPRFDTQLFSWAWKFLRSSNAAHVERAAPILRDLGLASRREFEALAAEFGNEFGLVQKGLLMLCKTHEGLEHEAALVPQARALGMSAERLTPEETANLEPNVQMDIAGSVYFPQDCHLSPQKLVAGLTRQITANGGTIYGETSVDGWRIDREGIASVCTATRDFTADAYVLAAGSWSAALARKIRLRMPMQAGKGYSVTLPAPRQLPAICALLSEARVAVTPMGQSLRFAGTMEIAGLDRSINAARVGGIFDAIPRYFPEFRRDDFSDLPVWNGLRPCSPDGLPYLGRFAGIPNLYAATGHAMMGVSLAPITGKLLAEMISGQDPEIDLELLSPDRYAK
jgi:D-amino-acid dehydrogenase